MLKVIKPLQTIPHIYPILLYIFQLVEEYKQWCGTDHKQVSVGEKLLTQRCLKRVFKINTECMTALIKMDQSG